MCECVVQFLICAASGALKVEEETKEEEEAEEQEDGPSDVVIVYSERNGK